MNEKHEKHDPVNHPAHYTSHPSGIECIAVTRHYNFCRGNAIKYLWRAGEKGNLVEDLRKAIWYINDEIKQLELPKLKQPCSPGISPSLDRDCIPCVSADEQRIIDRRLRAMDADSDRAASEFPREPLTSAQVDNMLMDALDREGVVAGAAVPLFEDAAVDCCPRPGATGGRGVPCVTMTLGKVVPPAFEDPCITKFGGCTVTSKPYPRPLDADGKPHSVGGIVTFGDPAIPSDEF